MNIDGHDFIEAAEIRLPEVISRLKTELEAYYSLILNSITEGIYTIDKDGICIYCNSSCWAMLNYSSAEDLLGKRIHDLIHFEDIHGDPNHHCKILNALQEGNEVFADDEVFWSADGKAVPVAYSVYPQVQEGQVYGAVVTFTRIADAQTTTNPQATVAANPDNLFKHANVGIVYTDAADLTISANQAFLNLVRYSLEELHLIKLQEITHVDDWERELALRQELAQGLRKEYRIEKRYRRRDGEFIWVHNTVSASHRPSGEPQVYVAIVHDIHDKKKYEQQLLESIAAKDKFFSIIAHDLLNPVGAIKTLSGFIHEDLIQNKIAEATELSGLLNEQADYTFNLLTSLLEWSRLQRKEITLKAEPLNLQELIEACVASHKILAENKHIKLEAIVDGSLIISADKDMLNSMLRNLVTNAIKFSYEHGSITITAEDRADEILISVRDQGKGIAPHMLNKLFLAESKTSTPGTHNETGTGLGLLLCKEFVELHGGKIWAESTFGSGSCFSFTLSKNLRS